MKQIKIIRTIGKLTNFLEANGISIEESEDFSGFEKLAKKVRGKKASGQFRLRNFDFNAENAFWIKFIYDGQPVSVQAGRLDNLGKDTLAHYWNNQQGRVYPKPNKVGGKHCPLAEEITGKVIFGGEFSIRHDLRKKGFSGPMIFLGLLLAFNRWQHADWIYGLMNEDLALVGFDHRQGFLRCNPRGFSLGG